MRYLYFFLALFIAACNSSSRNDDDENNESTVANKRDIKNSDVRVEFSCDSVGTNEFILSVVMSTQDESIPIDTLTRCAALGTNDPGQYQVPDNIEALAEGDDFIYYNAIQEDQLVVMRSPRGESMNYQVFLSIPIHPAINEE